MYITIWKITFIISKKYYFVELYYTMVNNWDKFLFNFSIYVCKNINFRRSTRQKQNILLPVIIIPVSKKLKYEHS